MLVLINQLELLEQVFGSEKAVSFLKSLILEDEVIEFKDLDDYQSREIEQKWIDIIRQILKERKWVSEAAEAILQRL